MPNETSRDVPVRAELGPLIEYCDDLDEVAIEYKALANDEPTNPWDFETIFIFLLAVAILTCFVVVAVIERPEEDFFYGHAVAVALAKVVFHVTVIPLAAAFISLFLGLLARTAIRVFADRVGEDLRTLLKLGNGHGR